MIKKLSLFLIGLGILIPSYSMAINTMLEPGIGEDLGGQNYCVVESNLGFVCTKTNNVLVSYGLDGNGALTSSYWWREDGLGFYTYNGNYPDRNLQGVITGFTFCSYDFIGNNSIKINDSLYWNNCFTRTYTYQEFKEYLSTHTLKKWSFWSFYINGGQGGPMFIFDEGAFRVGFGLGSSEYQNLFYGLYGFRNFNLAGDGLSVDYSNVGVKTSPGYVFVQNPVPDYSIGSGDSITNGDALLGFEHMGLSQQYCYGGFGLNNIFLPTEQFEDFSGYSFGSGASIFDLYNAYSGNNSLRVFAGQYKQSFVNGQLSDFHNKSKALLMFYQQIDSANNRGWGDFQVGDVLDYCSLLKKVIECNWTCDGDTYTGGNRNAINSAKNNKNNKDGGFTTTGVLNVGNYTGFSTPDEFFGRLNALFQNNIKAGEDNIVGVLPRYIIFFMLALILFRIISH